MTTYQLVTIGLSRTVSEINGNIRRKSPIFPTPVYLTPDEGAPLGIWYRRKGYRMLL